MSDLAAARWESALEQLGARGVLGQGQVAVLRMTRVIDVEDVVVLVVSFSLPRDIIERHRDEISAALSEQWGHPVTFEVTIDAGQDGGRQAGAPAPAGPVLASPAPVTTTAPAVIPSAPPSPALNPSPVQSPVRPSPAPGPEMTGSPATASPQPSTQPVEPGTTATSEAQPTTTPSGEVTAQGEAAASSLAAATGSDQEGGPVVPVHPTATLPTVPDDSRLNPRYTFTTYVQGKSNRLAKTAAVAVAEAPSRAYNPLFIYGGSGLGKTHLLHAIGHYARSLYPGITVKYVNSEEFVSDFIASVADGQMRNFKDRYRGVDILLVDDVQFFEGKEQTLEEFFHTFNALKIAEKQIVLTADTPASELKGFNNRLVSRFQEGLVADVQPPDLETRQAILTLKARADGIEIGEDVLEYIASRVTTNIRELEGALVRVTAFASLNKQPIDRTLAEVALKDVISNPDGEEITSSLIMAQVADYFGMTIDDLCGESRRKAFVHPRHVAMYLCRELTDLSLPNIGREFGGRDHTTVMSAHRKVAQQMGEKRETFNEVNELTSRIKQAALAPRP